MGIPLFGVGTETTNHSKRGSGCPDIPLTSHTCFWICDTDQSKVGIRRSAKGSLLRLTNLLAGYYRTGRGLLAIFASLRAAE